MTTSHNAPNRLFRAERLGILTIILPGGGFSSPESSFQNARYGAAGRVSTPPVTLAALATVQPRILSIGEDIAYSIDAAECVVSNAAGTQVLAVGWTVDTDVAAATTTENLPFATATQVFKTGTDLSFEDDGSGGTRIKSTAGGVFFVTFQVKVDVVGD